MAQDNVNPGGRPVWIALLSALTAAGLGFCALAILIPPLAGSWAAPFGGVSELAGWTFLWAAAVMLVAAQGHTEVNFRYLAVDWFLMGFPAQFALGLILFALGVQGVFWSAAYPFVGWLMLPGAAMIAVALTDESGTSANPEGIEDEPRESGRWPAILWIFVSALMMAGLMVAIGVVVGFGYSLYYKLEAALIEGRNVSLGSFYETLVRLMPDIVVTAFPTAFAVFFVWTALFSILAYVVPWVTRLTGGGGDATLTDSQAEVLEREIERINAYARAQGYEGYEWLQWAFGITFFPVFMSFMLAPWYGFSEIVALDNAAREAGHVWAISVRSGTGFSTIVLLFAGILLAMLPFQLAFLLFPRLAEISVWSGALTSGQPWWVDRLMSVIRNARTPAQAAPDPGRVLRDYAQRLCWYFVAPGLVLAGAGAYFWVLDRADYDLITPDRIVTVDYWTSKAHTHRHDDIEAVILECVYDDGDPEAEFGLQLANGDRVGIEVRTGDAARLDALTHIDEGLRARGARVEFAVREPWFRDPVVAYREECVKDLVEGLPAERAAQIERILHLDDWRGRK